MAQGFFKVNYFTWSKDKFKFFFNFTNNCYFKFQQNETVCAL